MPDRRRLEPQPHPALSPRAAAVVGVFGFAADLTPREGRSYDEWVHEVTGRFKRAWSALEGGLADA